MGPDENGIAQDQGVAAGTPPVAPSPNVENEAAPAPDAGAGGMADMGVPMESAAEVFANEAPKNKSKIAIAVIAVLVVAVGLGAFFFLRYSGENGEDAPPPEQTALTGMRGVMSLNPDAELIEGINQEIIDEELGYSIRVLRAIIGVEIDGGEVEDEVTTGNTNGDEDEDDNGPVRSGRRTGVMVELRINNATQYNDATLMMDSLMLVADGVAVQQDRDAFESMLSEVDGLARMRNVLRTDTLTGWMFFVIEEGAEDISFRYHRTAREVTLRNEDGSVAETQEVIPARIFDVVIKGAPTQHNVGEVRNSGNSGGED